LQHDGDEMFRAEHARRRLLEGRVPRLGHSLFDERIKNRRELHGHDLDVDALVLFCVPLCRR
jgi:hypothetical protein